MKKEEIHFGDLNRWLFGQAPPEFMIEVFIRTLVIYLFLLLAVRLMGKRMSGQITLTELAVMVTLGAIVSPIMQLPDRGIIFGVIGLLCAFLFQRGLNLWAFRDPRVEHITQGKISMLVRDGTLVLEELEKTEITRQQLFAMLRQRQIHNLGQVKRAYLEGCGILSVFEQKAPVAGLPLFPPKDPQITAETPSGHPPLMACSNCGQVQEAAGREAACPRCGAVAWSIPHLSNP